MKVLCSKIKLHFHKSLLPSTAWHFNVKHTFWAIYVFNTVLLNTADHKLLLLGILHNIAKFQAECGQSPWWDRQECLARWGGLQPMSKHVLSPELAAKARAQQETHASSMLNLDPKKTSTGCTLPGSKNWDGVLYSGDLPCLNVRMAGTFLSASGSGVCGQVIRPPSHPFFVPLCLKGLSEPSLKSWANRQRAVCGLWLKPLAWWASVQSAPAGQKGDAVLFLSPASTTIKRWIPPQMGFLNTWGFYRVSPPGFLLISTPAPRPTLGLTFQMQRTDGCPLEALVINQACKLSPEFGGVEGGRTQMVKDFWCRKTQGGFHKGPRTWVGSIFAKPPRLYLA